MRDYEERLTDTRMDYYRETYRDSRKWAGEDLDGKSLLVYGEQGHGDIIMFLRFLKYLKCRVILHVPDSLRRLVTHMGYEFWDKDNPDLPAHDFHVPSLNLPFVLRSPIPLEPYVHLAERFDLPPGLNVGVAWEGSPGHQHNADRNCPLEFFKSLDANLYMLQKEVSDWSLVAGCDDLVLHGVPVEDFYDVAKLINSLDAVVCVDTAALHLAGAMGRRGYGLLSPVNTDPRWQWPWYPTIKMLTGAWADVFNQIQLCSPRSRCQ